MMHYNKYINNVEIENFMSYRVLNSISVKNLSGKEFVKDKLLW